MKGIYIITFMMIALFILVFAACKKDDNTPANNNSTNNNNNNNNTTCNFTTNVLKIDATTKNILSDSCRVFGTNYYTEHWVDAARTEGIAIIFNGTTPPAAGTYTAVNNFTAVDATHVYVEYYDPSNAYQPASGTVTVADNGSAKVYTFCNFTCSSGSTNKTVSVRATCN